MVLMLVPNVTHVIGPHKYNIAIMWHCCSNAGIQCIAPALTSTLPQRCTTLYQRFTCNPTNLHHCDNCTWLSSEQWQLQETVNCAI